MRQTDETKENIVTWISHFLIHQMGNIPPIAAEEEEEQYEPGELRAPYSPMARRKAFVRFQKRHALLFPEWHFDEETMRIFCMEPSKYANLQTYWTYVDKAHPALLSYWQSTVTSETIQRLLQTELSIERIIKPGDYNDTSINGMWLYTVRMQSDATLKDLLPMTDGRRLLIIKSQALADDVDRVIPENWADGLTPEQHEFRRLLNRATYHGYHAGFEFTNEIILTRLLNTLVTGFRYTVTPHFTTFLGSFVGGEILNETGEQDKKSRRLHAIYERADRSLKDVTNDYDTEPMPLGEFAALLFQVLTALEAAARMVGFRHRDPHMGNIMARAVDGTKYADCVWLYKRAGQSKYYFIAPEHHQNRMIEIIDLGRSTIKDAEPRNREAMVASQFAQDAKYILVEAQKIVLFWYDMKIDQKLWRQVHEELAVTIARQLTDEKDHVGFLRRWPTLMPTLFSVFCKNTVEDFMSVDAAADDDENMPGLIAMSICPEDDILASMPMATKLSRDNEEQDDDVVLFGRSLQKLWKIRQGMKRTTYATCVVCRAPAEWETKDHHFCGQDCYYLHHGVYVSYGDITH